MSGGGGLFSIPVANQVSVPSIPASIERKFSFLFFVEQETRRSMLITRISLPLPLDTMFRSRICVSICVSWDER